MYFLYFIQSIYILKIGKEQGDKHIIWNVIQYQQGWTKSQNYYIFQSVF